MTDNSVIQSRLADMDRLRYFKRKAHAMRKVTAGDWSMFGDSAAANNPDAKAPLKPDGLYDILVMDVNEGKSNLIFQAVRTLTMQCTVQFPDITFPDIETEESDVNQLYLNARLGPKPRGCSAMDEMRLALLDYMISGIGWVWCGVRNGAPVVQCVDTLDMYWDCDAKLLTGIRWQAAAFHRPCSEWVKEFGAAYGDNDPDDPDEIETVLFYFDCDGKVGTYAAFKFDGQGLGDPIEVTPNPHFMTVDGERAPFLPIEPMYFMALPSVKFPMSLVEAMLAPAISYRQSEDYINQVTKMGKPFYDIEEGQLSEDERKNLEEGNYGAIVMRKIGSPAISIKPGMEIPGAVMNWMTINKQEIVANSGANPYASGNKVEGVTYAAEVNAIQNSAGLMAATISRDLGESVDQDSCEREELRLPVAQAEQARGQPPVRAAGSDRGVPSPGRATKRDRGLDAVRAERSEDRKSGSAGVVLCQSTDHAAIPVRAQGIGQAAPQGERGQGRRRIHGATASSAARDGPGRSAWNAARRDASDSPTARRLPAAICAIMCLRATSQQSRDQA